MGRTINKYINNIQCETGLDSIMTVEHRSNNPKRDYLFCNKLQAKHIPANPTQTLTIFDRLVRTVEPHLKDRKVVVVGFAETATAIGAYMSENLSSCVYHIQTTREKCNGCKKLIEFEEEHSHATEQYLYGNLNTIPDFDYILFVEDEISTGKTIMNFIHEFEKIKAGVNFGVASICNWQNSCNKQVYEDNNIDTFALIYGELADENAKMEVEIKDIPAEYAVDRYGQKSDVNKCTIEKIGNSTFDLERTGRLPHSVEYMNALNCAINKAREFVDESRYVLVLGTEECMYIPIKVAESLENMGVNARTHSTSRSCIDVMVDNTLDISNGLVNRTKLHSAYDTNRVTYVYNLRKYDKVCIVTDCSSSDAFKKDIVDALVAYGNKEENIKFIEVV